MTARVFPRRDGRLLVVLEGAEAAFQFLASRGEVEVLARDLWTALEAELPVLEASD